ncbi:hypothetical protein CfE428DRAFT_1287 [Chthoniobacter flavus Ellin428]|uniref:Uncharacterized protein n=1 Tax=Chthoniobacter flavus Ellin428 TaxID=497964 RepID=B4CXJ6_9BACT|nr:hypothetical protein CfE428DRAFT_1287 [Chthoniobacter flavus Ellin428]TCO88721.1 hypothetical protein EV701_11693 [Chthoniobacter flavus]
MNTFLIDDAKKPAKIGTVIHRFASAVGEEHRVGTRSYTRPTRRWRQTEARP